MSLDFYFLDVGQGDGTLIIFPNEFSMLVDLGSKKNSDTAGKDAITTIKTLAPQKNVINYLVLTHGDADHTNLLLDLVAEGFSFGEVFYGGERTDYSEGDVAAKIITVFKGQPFPDSYFTPAAWKMIGGVTVRVLAANVKTRGDHNKNQKSVVLMFEYGSRRVILCGDAETTTENFILTNTPNVRAEVLKLAHHGASTNSNSDAWLSAVQPKLVVASADQAWGHPYSETIDRLKATCKLGKIFNHTYVAGKYEKKSKDYDWKVQHGKEAILTTLYDIEGKLGVEWKAKGVCYGVYINGNGDIWVGDTLDSPNLSPLAW